MWLAEKNDWVGEWEGPRGNKKIALFMSDDKLKLNTGRKVVYLDVDWESKDEVLAWSFENFYLECRPGPEFIKQRKKMPNYGANFFQNLRN